MDAINEVLHSNIINLVILTGLVILVQYRRNVVIYSFIAFYAAYVVSDFGMTSIELAYPTASIDEYRQLWHLMLAVCGMLIIFYIWLAVLLLSCIKYEKFLCVLTSGYILLFYVMREVGWSGLTAPDNVDLYNFIGSISPIFDIALIALSLTIKERGNGCDKLAYRRG